MFRDPIDRKHIPLLWGKAAGCCELCSSPVYEESLLRHQGNYSNIAHINAASPGGPRYDARQTPQERGAADNLMLLCRACHKLIDDNPDDFSASMLRAAKADREQAIASLMEGLKQEKCTVLKYLVPFGESIFSISDTEWKRALFSRRLAFWGNHAFDLNRSGENARDASNIPALAKSLEVNVARFRELEYDPGPIAVFALAPQPLLIKLGSLLGDETELIVFQRSRTEGKWCGNDHVPDPVFEFKTLFRSDGASEAVLILSISGAVDTRTLPADMRSLALPTFEITVPSAEVGAADHSQVAEMFRPFATDTLYQIHQENPGVRLLHIFPAMPASLNVVFGAALNTNVIPRYIVYEKRDGVFAKSLTIGGKDEPR